MIRKSETSPYCTSATGGEGRVLRDAITARQEGGQRCITQVYSDMPTQYRIFPAGLIEPFEPANLFLTWKTRQLYNPLAVSTLSLRWVTDGQRFFETGNRRYAVDDRSYRIFNAGSEFSSEINSETPVQSYTICFQPQIAEDVLRALILPADRLLDAPQGYQDGEPLHFMEKAYDHDDLVSPILRRLQALRESEIATHGWFEEQFQMLLVAMLQTHRNVLYEVENVPAVRASTREELYRRLHQARDFMEAHLHCPLTIPLIADAACFSPHHFLRLFKQLFQETPHQYLTRRRIELAKYLLRKTDRSVTDICFAVGFESLGSFSWLFRRKVGVSPEAFRFQTEYPALKMAANEEKPWQHAGLSR